MANYSIQDANAIVDSVSFYASVSKAFVQLSERLYDQSQRIARLESGLLSLFDKPIEPVPLTDAQQVVSEPLSALSSRTGSRAIGIAGLSTLIPLLFNEESRNHLSSFLKGVIGAETMENIATGLKLAAGALAGVLTYKLIKQVGDTVQSISTLSKMVGTLFGLTEAASEDVSEEKRKIDERKKRDIDRRKQIRKNRVKRAQRLQKLKSIVGKVKVGGPIGLAIGTVVGIGLGVVLDLINQSDQKQQDEEDKAIESDSNVPEASDNINTENISTIISKNIVEQLSLGLLSWDSVKKSIQAIGGDEQAAAENRQAISGTSTTDAEMGGTMDANVSSEEYSEPAQVESKSPIGPLPEIVDNAQIEQSKAEQDMSTPTSGSNLNTSSENVISTKKLIKVTPTVVVNNIDNSVIVAKAA